jgi:hypothetical protein
MRCARTVIVVPPSFDAQIQGEHLGLVVLVCDMIGRLGRSEGSDRHRVAAGNFDFDTDPAEKLEAAFTYLEVFPMAWAGMDDGDIFFGPMLLSEPEWTCARTSVVFLASARDGGYAAVEYHDVSKADDIVHLRSPCGS